MTAPLSQDLRERIVHAVEDGSTIRQAARRFAVSASAAIKLMQRVRETGSTAPAKIGGSRRPLLEKHADDLRAIVSSQAGITLREVRAALAIRGIVVKALSTIADMLHRLDLSHKKEPESLFGNILHRIKRLWCKDSGLSRGEVADVDNREPCAVRPQQTAVSERFDG